MKYSKNDEYFWSSYWVQGSLISALNALNPHTSPLKYYYCYVKKWKTETQ